jgi:hypothetical protein
MVNVLYKVSMLDSGPAISGIIACNGGLLRAQGKQLREFGSLLRKLDDYLRENVNNCVIGEKLNYTAHIFNTNQEIQRVPAFL